MRKPSIKQMLSMSIKLKAKTGQSSSVSCDAWAHSTGDIKILYNLYVYGKVHLLNEKNWDVIQKEYDKIMEA